MSGYGMPITALKKAMNVLGIERPCRGTGCRGSDPSSAQDRRAQEYRGKAYMLKTGAYSGEGVA